MAEGNTFKTEFSVCHGGTIQVIMGQGDHNVFENIIQSMGTVRLDHDSARDETQSQEESKDNIIMENKKVMKEISELLTQPDSHLKIAIAMLDHYLKGNDDDAYSNALKTFYDIIRAKPRYDDIIHLASDYITKKKYFRAFLTLRATMEWFGEKLRIETKSGILSPFVVLDCMCECALKALEDKSSKFKTGRQIISLMYEAINNVKQIEEADEKERIECEGAGLLWVAIIHHVLRENQAAYDVSCRGLDVMETKVKKHENENLLCSWLKYWKAVAAIGMGRENAEDLVNKAKSAIQRAEMLEESKKNNLTADLDERLKESRTAKQAE